MKLCVIGASSSVGQRLLTLASDRYEKIYGSYHTTPITLPNIDSFQLDLSKELNENNRPPNEVQQVDYLVFLQGILYGKSLGNYQSQEITQTIFVNLVSTLQIINYFMQNRLFSKDPHICLVSSIAATQGSFDATYAASKNGLLGLLKSLSKTIRTNAIAPGLLENSGMYKQMSETDHQRHLEQTPTGQHTTVDQLAQMILDINTHPFCNMNGNVIHVNGGRYV